MTKTTTPADAEACTDIGAEPKPRHQMAPQQFGEAMGNVIGWGVIVLLVFIGAVSLLAGGLGADFFTWAGKTLATLF